MDVDGSGLTGSSQHLVVLKITTKVYGNDVTRVGNLFFLVEDSIGRIADGHVGRLSSGDVIKGVKCRVGVDHGEECNDVLCCSKLSLGGTGTNDKCLVVLLQLGNRRNRINNGRCHDGIIKNAKYRIVSSTQIGYLLRFFNSRGIALVNEEVGEINTGIGG